MYEANLSGANLRGSDLSGSDLSGSNLRGSDIDFSCFSFSCKSRKPKTDERQRIQLCHHFLSWIKYADDATDEEKAIFENLKAYANRFHRDDVERL
ncbi:Pentapeptide repeats (8 copies) [Bacteroidales bacterium Barb6XT]|nr:Pentapeptide repeats (8 copies) [Bacteroidales bacterium Barb6XT]